MPKPRTPIDAPPIDAVIVDIANLSERLLPVGEIGEMTNKRCREHLLTLTKIVGELAMIVKERK